MGRALSLSILTLALLGAGSGAHAGQRVTAGHLLAEEGHSTTLRPLHHEDRGIFGGPLQGHQQHDREIPFVRGEEQRIWNGPPGWGAGLPQEPWRTPRSPATSAGELPRPGGDLRRRIRQAIRRNRAERYSRHREGLELLERYRAEKALLGLCPVDRCETPRLVVEGRPFSPEGYCREHSEERFGLQRVEWAVEAARERTEARAQASKERWERDSVGRFRPGSRGYRARHGEDGISGAEVRTVLGQPPLPEGFPRPGDLGPNGTPTRFADPRDPAGYPYDSVDPAPPLSDARPEVERKTWVQQSLMAP